MPFENARQMVFRLSPARAGRCLGLVTALLFLSSQALQDAVADGETRTISMHHLHTNEDITITYKRNGRYDEEALKKINWFLRDWRRKEAIKMDPHLIDLVWEVWHEFDTKKPIDIVCGYRSPQTNAMLRHRSGGVARYSQHMLGKAMDFYIPGVPLEKIRVAGLRLARGGVGYYPTSGSPFVHLDTGGVRYWPRMSREQLARIFPDGRTAYLPSDGRPLRGYALALADIRKRGGNSSTGNSAVDAGMPKRSLFARLFGIGKDPDEAADAQDGRSAPSARERRRTATRMPPAKRSAKSIATASAAPPATYEVASVSSKPVHLNETANPSQSPDSAANDVITDRGYWHGPAAQPSALQPVGSAAAIAAISHSTNEPEATASIGSASSAGDGHAVAATSALAYATQSDNRSAMHAARPMGRALPSTLVIGTPSSTIVKARPGEPSHIEAAIEPVRVGQRYDNPWLRAMIVTPGVKDFMKTALWGSPDFLTLAPLMVKPRATLRMAFSLDPNRGMETTRFSGEAVVFLSTINFERRTASLQ